MKVSTPLSYEYILVDFEFDWFHNFNIMITEHCNSDVLMTENDYGIYACLWLLKLNKGEIIQDKTTMALWYIPQTQRYPSLCIPHSIS